MITCTRVLEIDAGHRLINHEGKCRNVHGHRYKFEIKCEASRLDDVGRVIDFGEIKRLVGGWLDEEWDHGFIHHCNDPIAEAMKHADRTMKFYAMGVAPTAENIASEVLKHARELLRPGGIRVVSVRCWETPNCWADAE